MDWSWGAKLWTMKTFSWLLTCNMTWPSMGCHIYDWILTVDNRCHWWLMRLAFCSECIEQLGLCLCYCYILVLIKIIWWFWNDQQMYFYCEKSISICFVMFKIPLDIPVIMTTQHISKTSSCARWRNNMWSYLTTVTKAWYILNV